MNEYSDEDSNLELARLQYYENVILSNSLENLSISDDISLKDFYDFYKSTDDLNCTVPTEIFDNCRYYLEMNFNLIFYGVGSKRSILINFIQKYFKDYNCVIIDGFRKKLKIRTALKEIYDMYDKSFVYTSLMDYSNHLLDIVDKDNQLIILINNIDGPIFWKADNFKIILKYTKCKYIRIVCSVDHINSFILFDSYYQHNWLKININTFMAHLMEINETFSLSSVGESYNTGCTFEGLKYLIKSITSNSKNIFTIICQFFKDNDEAEGMNIDQLYNTCRENFLVNSLINLKAHLNEFIDHRLLKISKSNEYGEIVVIVCKKSILVDYLNWINED
ncbi:Origin recognition complex subunit 2 [Intoshia linei]|uniref:Origin recognition complex subunit 2 n=1 Tax=Intoshia linei TaxID=1819745 RepID=A0A177BC76_9BILA|nr:Origin recognition complex subunit 2 [Intoshia linei]